MKAYFDTSTFAMLAFADKGYDVLDRWIVTRAPDTCLSNFGWGEFVSTVGRRVRANDLDDTVGERLLLETKVYLETWTSLSITSEDVDSASRLIADSSLNLRLPDAIHIATAQRIEAVLITADRHQLRAARQFGYAAINPLFDETKS